MNDDLDYVRARIPGYAAYGDETMRHDSDMRVRAFVGERLASVRSRLAPLAEPVATDLDAVQMRCIFTDQVFVKKFEHAELDTAMTAGLVRADRTILEIGAKLEDCSAPELPDIVRAIGESLDYRRSPEPVS